MTEEELLEAVSKIRSLEDASALNKKIISMGPYIEHCSIADPEMTLSKAIDLAEKDYSESEKLVYVIINCMGYDSNAISGVYETLDKAKDEYKKEPENRIICSIQNNATYEDNSIEVKEGHEYLCPG